jgi:long-chain acyl-CoA synthetase
MKGMEAWVFGSLEEEAERRVHAPRVHRDLLELLESGAARFGPRTALRRTGERKDRFTYTELRGFALRVTASLRAAGTAPGDRVLLASENRPEWAAAFFGILAAGGVAVPVDAQLSERELRNLWRTSGARIAILSDEVAERLPDLLARPEGASRALLYAEAFAGGPEAPPHRAAPDDPASLIFTSGTTGTPKGVLLSHRNFTSLVAKLSEVFDLRPGDGLLSVLPLHHTFEFTCGLLVPLSRGAEVEYLDELTADRLGDALESGRITAMIGVPALWSLLHRRISQEIAAKPGFVDQAFRMLRKANAALRDSDLGWNAGKLLFWPVHRRLGGRLRILVSGGAALDPAVQEAFRELGFDLFQGYGLTEAAPVLAVSTPGGDAPTGSVGPALPGVELRIEDPDATGVGEVLARGPNVMLGYWKGGDAPGVDAPATAEVLEGGWLRTGDLGRLDADGNLVLVGRKKDVIIDASGKNVHPDEIEDLYRAPDLVKELCVVGLPDGTGEKVAMLLVPNDDGRDAAAVRAAIEAHVRKVSASLPFHKRVKVWHATAEELPKTATRKVKRPWVREELLRREGAAAKGRRARDARERGGSDAWLLDLVAEVARRPRGEVTHATRLAGDLGFDSLMIAELAAALEEAGVPSSLADRIHQVDTVGELSRAMVSAAHRPDEAAREVAAPREETGPEDVVVPGPLAALGRRVLGAGQELLYRGIYGAKVTGLTNVPRDRVFLVVANHASHLDMGLVKVALGDAGKRLAALAARDYFFDTRLKRAYFENFTNLIPMERAGSLRQSLRAALQALRSGRSVLIFPEGTRSRDGRMHEFYPTAGYLALQGGVDVLPVFIGGTHAALPPGQLLPRDAKLEVRIGRPIPVAELRRRTESLARSDAYRAATAAMEDAVRALGGASAGERSRGTRDGTESAPTSSGEQRAGSAPGAGGSAPRGEATSASTRSHHAPSPEAATASTHGHHAAPAEATSASTRGHHAAPPEATSASTRGQHAAPAEATSASTRGHHAAPPEAASASTRGHHAAPPEATSASTRSGAPPAEATPAGDTGRGDARRSGAPGSDARGDPAAIGEDPDGGERSHRRRAPRRSTAARSASSSSAPRPSSPAGPGAEGSSGAESPLPTPAPAPAAADPAPTATGTPLAASPPEDA